MSAEFDFLGQQGIAGATIVFRFIGKPHAILGGKFGGRLEGLH
jgi:hypothetical protein